MNSVEFRKRGYEMIEYVANFMDTVAEREPAPAPHVQPGYLTKVVPLDPPEEAEPWGNIMKDLEPVIHQGMVQWQHPNFHAYLSAGNSWPSVLADIISNVTGTSCATWETCPAATELEVIVTDWTAKMLDIPRHFWSIWSNPESQGGGVIQGSASEATFIAIISAREYAIAKLEKQNPGVDRAILKDKLVAYANDQSHSCMGKGCLMADVKYRLIEPHALGFVEGIKLREHIQRDIQDGLVPFFLNCILGSTSIGCFDDLMQTGPIASAYDMWVHVDCAYAGSMFSCPETRYLKRGMEHAWSVTVNCNKWMLTSFDCSLMWVRYKHLVNGPLSGYEPAASHGLPNYRHWGIANTRRFRAIKLWCVLRAYGQKGIRRYVRNHIALAKRIERGILRDPLFEIIGELRTGLCCFAYRGNSHAADHLTERLLEALNASRKIHMVPGICNGKYVIRYAVCHEFASTSHTDEDLALIREYAQILNRLYAHHIQEIIETSGIDRRSLDIETQSTEALVAITKVLQDLKLYNHRKSIGEMDFIAMETVRVEDTFATHEVTNAKQDEYENEEVEAGFHHEIDADSFTKLEEELKVQINKQDEEYVQSASTTDI